MANNLAVVLNYFGETRATSREFFYNYRIRAMEIFTSQWPGVNRHPAAEKTLNSSVKRLFLSGLFFWLCDEASVDAIRNVIPHFWTENPQDLLDHEDQILQALAAHGTVYEDQNWPNLQLHPKWFAFKEDLLNIIAANPPNNN